MMYKAAFKKLFWAMIFIIFDFNLGIINILPNFVGYILFYAGLSVLSERHKAFERGKNLSVILVLLTVKDIIKFQNNNPAGIQDWISLTSMILGTAVMAMNIYLIYLTCKGIYLLYEEGGFEELKAPVRAYWKFYFVTSILLLVYVPFSLNFAQKIGIFMIIGLIFNVIASLFIAYEFRRAGRELREVGDDKMFKGKSKLIILILVSGILASWLLIQNIEPKLTSEEKTQIVAVINSYYNKIMDEDYEGALGLVDISGADYDKAISILKGNKSYRIERSLEGDSWLIPCNGRDEVFYDQQRKSFYTQTGARIIESNYKYEATENVYVKKVGKEFKITNIVTDDRFGFIRGAYVKNFR